MSKTEIDAVTAEFFGAFDNRGGKVPDVDRIGRLVIPGGVIVVTGPQYAVHTVEEFVEPRRRLLTDGRLVEFCEWETSERTEIAGDIASRFGTYRKAGVMDGTPFEGGGHKTFQFVRTRQGWRIAAFAWHDHASPAGPLPAGSDTASVADSEAAHPVGRLLDLVEQGDSQILRGDLGAAVGVDEQLVGAGPEVTRACAGPEDGGRAQVCPVHAGRGSDHVVLPDARPGDGAPLRRHERRVVDGECAVTAGHEEAPGAAHHGKPRRASGPSGQPGQLRKLLTGLGDTAPPPSAHRVTE